MLAAFAAAIFTLVEITRERAMRKRKSRTWKERWMMNKRKDERTTRGKIESFTTLKCRRIWPSYCGKGRCCCGFFLSLLRCVPTHNTLTFIVLKRAQKACLRRHERNSVTGATRTDYERQTRGGGKIIRFTTWFYYCRSLALPTTTANVALQRRWRRLLLLTAGLFVDCHWCSYDCCRCCSRFRSVSFQWPRAAILLSRQPARAPVTPHLTAHSYWKEEKEEATERTKRAGVWIPGNGCSSGSGESSKRRADWGSLSTGLRLPGERPEQISFSGVRQSKRVHRALNEREWVVNGRRPGVDYRPKIGAKSGNWFGYTAAIQHR